MTTIPNGSLYESILDSYFGTSFANAQKGFVTEKDVLWQNFLSQNGLSPTDPRVVNQDPAVLQEFVTFMRQTYNSLQTDQLSPGEITNRSVMFSVYQLIVLMMETLQSNAGVTGQNVQFLSNYKLQYSDLQSTEASNFYIGGSLSTPKPNSANLADWSLGYGGINMQEYLKTAISGITTSPTKGGPVVTNYPGDSGSNVPPLRLNSVNIAYPPPAPGPIGVDTALLTDALGNVPQYRWLTGLPGIVVTDHSNLSSQAMNALQFSSNASSVTFTYTYMQQYNYSYTTTTNDSNGNVANVTTTGPITGFYPVIVSHTVNYDPGLSDEKKLGLVEQGFQSFMNQQLSLSAYPPNASYPPNSTFFPAVGISIAPNAQFTEVTTNIGFPSNMSVYASMTQPITFGNVSVNSTNGTSSGVTAIRALTIPWNSMNTADLTNLKSDINDDSSSLSNSNIDWSLNTPYTTTTAQHAAAIQSNVAQKRGNQNSLLQQFITNAQSQGQIISNLQDAQTSQQNQSQTGINQAASVLNSAISQLSDIITSLTQGSKRI
jgi:hypothetical protein